MRLEFPSLVDVDKVTGMPSLPLGQFWHIERGLVQVRGKQADSTIWEPLAAMRSVCSYRDEDGPERRAAWTGRILHERVVESRTAAGYEAAVVSIVREIPTEGLFGDYFPGFFVAEF